MKIWLAFAAIEQITRLAESYSPLETGGVLMGWRSGPNRVVAAIIGPGPRALHGRHMFLPDHEWQVGQIDLAFAASKGDLDYLGDWHTHPDGVAALSALDRKTLHKLGRKTPDAIMAIAAPIEAGWEIAAWRQPRGRWLERPEAEICEVVPFDSQYVLPRW